MKLAPFRYARPLSLEEAVDLLAEKGADAVVLAGGQSLIPLLAFRMARPDVVVDINRIEGFADIMVEEHAVALGALTRQEHSLSSDVLRTACPLLIEALPFVGVRETRLRGTVVGSITHADPAAEIPTVAVALDAELHLLSESGKRVVRAEDFFLGPFLTDRQPTELVTDIRFPLAPPRSAWAFRELARGPLAVVAVAAGLVLGEDGRIVDARLAYAGVGPTPVRAPTAERLLLGEQPDVAAFEAAAEEGAAELDQTSDFLASSAYRRLASRQLAEDALLRAADQVEVA